MEDRNIDINVKLKDGSKVKLSFTEEELMSEWEECDSLVDLILGLKELTDYNFLRNKVLNKLNNQLNAKPEPKPTFSRDDEKAMELRYNLNNFSLKNRKPHETMDWNDPTVDKYCIVYDHATKDLKVVRHNKTNCGGVYFASEGVATVAMNVYCAELIWYFTKYSR